ncbi:hypothetical protein C8Q77DRAFT_1140540 [Trametes polyzona]|nr:hypothetical protein C8Q77DRAFT_1140540 [Trametes polyzona]
MSRIALPTSCVLFSLSFLWLAAALPTTNQVSISVHLILYMLTHTLIPQDDWVPFTSETPGEMEWVLHALGLVALASAVMVGLNVLIRRCGPRSVEGVVRLEGDE